MLRLIIASYDVIGSVDFYMVLRWVFYVIHEVCWVIYEGWVSNFVMLYEYVCLKLKKDMWVFTLVALRWYLSVDCGIYTIHALHQVSLKGYLGVNELR